jgi:hypothetical protein
MADVLAQVEAALAADGLTTQRVSAPVDALLARLESMGDATWRLELALMSEAIEGVRLLQCMVPIAEAVPASSELDEAIVRIDGMLPLGGFGFHRPASTLFYKAVLPLPQDDAEAAALVTAAVPLMTFLLTAFVEPLLVVARGQATAEEALAENLFARELAR